MENLLIIIQVILIFYFGYVGFYTFTFGFAGLFYKKPKIKGGREPRKFAVLIPAYKEDAVIVDVARQALNQTYPAENYDVVVIADSLQPSTLSRLSSLPIKTIEVKFKKSTKVKAMNTAMQQLGDHYDQVIILDADNVMESTFIEKANDLHQQGYAAIQGRRAAKNEDTTLSYLDGLSEEINNHIYGKGSTVLGLSASLKGSGMSFNYAIFKSILSGMDSVGGFDRELELRLVDKGIKVKYASNVVVRDEKVEQSKVFENQRKRWISSQYFYLRKYFISGLWGLAKGRITYFNSSVLRNIQLPRLINLGLINVITGAFFFFQAWLNFPYEVWIAIWGMTMLGVTLAIPRAYYDARLASSILRLPIIFWKMLLLLFRLKGSNAKFIHTPHSSPSQK